MKWVRIASLTIVLTVLFMTTLMVFSYPNNVSTMFAPTPTPVPPRCAHGSYYVVNGTPMVHFSEVCK